MKEVLAENGSSSTAGYIVRTAAEGVERAELYSDAKFLQQLWRHLEKKMAEAEVPSIIYSDLPLHLQVLRDMVVPGIEKIRVDSRETLDSLKEFAAEFCPEMDGLFELYQGEERPLFYMYGIEGELEKALSRKVPLKSGGYLVFDQTEAMTTVDVNTGAFVGRSNLEETIFKTNLEAVVGIARQLRLRNLGGIIILDLIDMQELEHRRQVLRTLEKALARDRVKTSIAGISELGLVEMTRKRTSESLENQLCEPCHICGGRATLKTAETVCYEIMREITRESRVYECSALLVLASQVVIDRLLDEDSANIADLEEFIGCPIQFRVETVYTQEQFDIVPV